MKLWQAIAQRYRGNPTILGYDLLNEPIAPYHDIATLNQLHLEVNRPVIIHLTSKDVIHSFFLPVMRVKQDAIPGQDVAIHFTPDLKHKAQPMSANREEHFRAHQ